MYSPKIKPELVKKLYLLKHSGDSRKQPMTKMVNEAVEEYLKRRQKNEQQEKDNKNSS